MRLPHEDAYSIDSESKLQKFDFWLRYPDYLAAALLKQAKSGAISSKCHDEVKHIIRDIFSEGEPELRWIPMRKYLRGAYEPLDELFSYLSCRKLAYKRVTGWGHCSKYFLTEKGCQAVEGLLQTCPESAWYADRCQLLQRFFGHLTGHEIRAIQYREYEYSTASYKDLIPRIEEKVRENFEAFFGEAL